MSQHYLTHDLAGTGGVIKQRAADFVVHEQPLYEPSGQGEHLYLLIEKTGHTTQEVIRRLAHAFEVSRRDIGYAGLKDKHAITRQMFSVYLPDKSRDQQGVASLEHSIAKVLWADRHGNKLRRGHHAGNVFHIRIRDVQPAHVLRARAILQRLSQHGVPNYYGQQRFGIGAINDQLGVMLLREQWQDFLDLALSHHTRKTSQPLTEAGQLYAAGDYAGALAVLPRSMTYDRQMLEALRQKRSAKQAVLALDAQHRAFLINALQGAMFNHVLSKRLTDGTLTKLLPGDLAWKHDSGAVFEVDDATAVTENAADGRVVSLAVSPSGPLWGPRMTQAKGQPLAMEREALAHWQLDEDALSSRSWAKVEGARRPLRMVLRESAVQAGSDEHGPFIQVSFGLERGGFATVVLEEIMKTGGQASQTDAPANDAEDDTQAAHDEAMS